MKGNNVEKAGGQALPVIVDVRDELQVRKAVEAAVERFGGIDILINNASAISLTPTLKTDMKRYDLMQNINTRGTFLVTKECLPYLLKSSHAHILNMAPPLLMSPNSFAPHVAYTIAKFGMSMCVLGMAEEFKDQGIAVNALWPRYIVHTAATDWVRGSEAYKTARKVDIMADSAYGILIQDPGKWTGKFFLDEDVLTAVGVKDLKQYSCVPGNETLRNTFFTPDTVSKL